MNRKSHDALEVGAVPLILNVSAVALTCGLCVFVNLDGCEVRRCDPCALVRLRVPCVSFVCPGTVPALSRLPPVSFYSAAVSAVTWSCGCVVGFGWL